MKTVMVNVQVQLDIPDTGQDLVEVMTAFDNINSQLNRDSDENYGIQIFSSSLDNSDITEMEKEVMEEEAEEQE